MKIFGVEVIEDARVPVGEIRLGTWDGPVLIENLAPPAAQDCSQCRLPVPEPVERLICEVTTCPFRKRSLEDSLTGAQKWRRYSGEQES